MEKHRVSLTYHEVNSLVFILLIARCENDGGFDKRMRGCGISLDDLFKRFHSAREKIESRGNIE